MVGLRRWSWSICPREAPPKSSILTPKSHPLWGVYSSCNPYSWEVPVFLLSFLLLTTKCEPLHSWHLNFCDTHSVRDLRAPWCYEFWDLPKLAFVPHAGDAPSGLREEWLTSPVKCLVICSAIMAHCMPQPGRCFGGCAAVATSFHHLAPLSLQVVKQWPLTHPAALLESSPVAGTKYVANSEPNTLLRLCVWALTGGMNTLCLSELLQSFHALAGVAQWIERRPVNRRVSG